ncbi:MAG: hypothetical protein M3R62_14150 [Acidobacteriota bacterium]|nr:hypothetical protein [Acidobacteriota bacterium]
MHPRLPLLLFALAALLVVLTPSGCSDNNNVAGPPATATPAVSTATPTSPGATATATRTVTPGTTATPTRTPTSPASAYAGVWTGTWNNTTFGSSGSASLVDTVNTSAQTFQATLTLGGNVFGAGTPAPQNFSGSYATGTFTQFSPLFGNVTINFTSPGAFTGSATNVPNPNIARIDFTGTATTQTILVNYTITFTAAGGGGTAVGTMTLNHVSS